MMNPDVEIELRCVEVLTKERHKEFESKGYQKCVIDKILDTDYSRMEREGINLFKQIIEGRNEMHDYTTSTLVRGGYNYRKICEIFKINTITVKFYEGERVCIESPRKIIFFENQKLHLYEKVPQMNCD